MKSLCVAFALALAVPVMAQDVPSNVVMLDISKVKWEKGPLGIGEVAKIYGDQAKPGPYSYLTKPMVGSVPPSRPHTHPDDRTYTVIAGTWYVGFGHVFDESKLIALKPGSVYTEPAGVPHFVLMKEEGTIVQITGTGPSRLVPVGQ